jgi:hypothetical protein
MLLGGKDMGAVFAPFYNGDFSPLTDGRYREISLGVAMNDMSNYSEEWIEKNIPKHQKIYPNIRMVCVLQNQNIFPLNCNNRKNFDVDCSDGEWNMDDMVSTRLYNWSNKIGDKFRQQYRYYIGSMFDRDFQDLIVRYKKNGVKSDASYVEECEHNTLFKNCVSRSRRVDGNGNYRVDKGEDLKWGNNDEWRGLNRWSWGLFKDGYKNRELKKHLANLNLGYTNLEWNAICGMLDATFFCYNNSGLGGSMSYKHNIKKILLKWIKDFERNDMITPRFLNVLWGKDKVKEFKRDVLLFFYKVFDFQANGAWLTHKNIFELKDEDKWIELLSTFPALNELRKELLVEDRELGEGVCLGDEYLYGFIRCLWGWIKMDENWKWVGFRNREAQIAHYNSDIDEFDYFENWRDFTSDVKVNRLNTDE